jgi:hypothetical protein
MPVLVSIVRRAVPEISGALGENLYEGPFNPYIYIISIFAYITIINTNVEWFENTIN